MTDELEQRITQLEREVRQLRAKEGAIAAFNQYLYGIDTGFIPDILDAFSENAILDVINFCSKLHSSTNYYIPKKQ